MDEDIALKEQCQARLGEQLSGKWTLEALIGVGGMAAVYLGRHRNGATAAIKLLHLEFAGHSELRARFQREAYIANKVDHPGAVKVLDDDVTTQGEPYLVMELLKGTGVENLAALHAGRLPLGHTIGIVEQTLAVLVCAHAAGIVHRDLKPDNLFLTEQGMIKVLDFGIARLREGAETKRTRTGLLMGTPAFMAPEQALGRWSEVDARTDLWAVGAIMFSLLTGRVVHEAASANEMIVLSATRPAPSLGRFVSVPLGLVALVDRALDFDRGRRFPSAAEMRSELLSLMKELGIEPSGTRPAPLEMQPGAAAEGTPAPGLRPAAPVPEAAAEAAVIPFASTQPGIATPTDVQPARLRDGTEAYDPAFASSEDIEAMQQVFAAMERALVSSVQYGSDHPEALRRYERLFSQVASALMHTESALVWNITPYSFVAKDQTLWEPKTPFDRIPYQLFSDGIRLLGLLPGLTQAEFNEFLRILILDRAREMAPEDDFVTLFWDSCFEHVVHQALDVFVEGDQAARASFARRVAETERLARFDTSLQLEDCWQGYHGRGGTAPDLASVETRRQRLLRALTAPRGADVEASAKAAALRRGEPQPDIPVHAEVALKPDPAVIQALGARMQSNTGVLGERFVFAAAAGYRQAARLGAPGSVSGPLSTAIDALAEKQPEMAIEMIGALCRQLDQPMARFDGKELGGALISEIVSRRTMERLLEGARSDSARQGLYWQGLRTVLAHVDDQHIPVVLKALANVTESALMEALMEYLGRVARGHEKQLGELFPTADLEAGLALVRVLATLETREARDAIMVGCSSPHPLVRVEALGYVEGVSSERLRLELRSLLEDREVGVRVAALRTMETYGIRAAGPFLVLRIRSPVFNKLPLEERQTALTTVAKLAPRRAEDICVEILGDSRVLGSEAYEQSREIAAELLGRLATAQESVALLQEEVGKRWRTSERVRAAAARALEQIRQRSAGASPAKPT